MSSASTAIMEIIFSPADWLIVWNNYGNERARPWLNEEPVQPGLLIYLRSDRKPFRQHNVHVSLPRFTSVWTTQHKLKVLTYNLELRAGIDSSVFIFWHTLIHPRVQQTNPGYGQSPTFHLHLPLQIRHEQTTLDLYKRGDSCCELWAK